MSAINPYQAPTAYVEDVGVNAELERIRRGHINHEASLKSVGILYYLGAFLMAFGSVGASFGLLGAAAESVGGSTAAFLLLMLVLCVTSVIAGHGLRTLKSWARIPAGILSGLGLLAFPLGTLINGYILWLLFSTKGKSILSSDYAAIVAATPHVRYRTPIIVWTFIGLLSLLLVVSIAGLR